MTDPLIAAARFLQSQLEWMRHATADNGEPYAVSAFAEIDWCAGRLRGLVNGPSEKRYLGPCGARLVMACEVCEQEIPVGDTYTPIPGTGGLVQCGLHALYLGELRVRQANTCDGDVYVRGDAPLGRCEACGTTVPRAARKEWLDAQVGSSDLVWTAIGIAHALGLNVKTIRSWAVERRAPNGVILRRAKLATYWHNGEQLVPWVDPLPGQNVKARGDRLHYVADVAKLAEEAAQRRTEEQQTTEEDAA